MIAQIVAAMVFTAAGSFAVRSLAEDLVIVLERLNGIPAPIVH